MILWSASSIGKRVSLLGLLALSVWLLTGTHANGQAPTTPATSTAAAKKTIQGAQERLLALGYQPGATDGVMGSKAIAALKKFQADHSLPVTGQLDRKTIVALNVLPTGAVTKPTNKPLGQETEESVAGIPAQNPEPPASAEKYEEVDAQELHIDLQGSMRFIHVGAGGDLADLDMAITKLAVGTTDIERKTDRVEIDPDDHHFGAISTKDFGIFRLQFDSGGGMSLWLKPSQKKSLMNISGK